MFSPWACEEVFSWSSVGVALSLLSFLSSLGERDRGRDREWTEAELGSYYKGYVVQFYML